MICYHYQEGFRIWERVNGVRLRRIKSCSRKDQRDNSQLSNQMNIFLKIFRWSQLKTLMLNDLQQINQERISYKYNIQHQKAVIRNPKATTLIPSAFIQNTSFPNSLRRVTINKWEWLSAAIKKLQGDSYMPILDQKIYVNSDQIYQGFHDELDKKGQNYSPKGYSNSRNQYFMTVRQERHQHQILPPAPLPPLHHQISNGHYYPIRGYQSVIPNNRIARAMTRNQKVQADLLQRQEYEITKSTRQSILHKYQKVYKQMAELENEGCQNQALHQQLLQSEEISNIKQVIKKLFKQITTREEMENLELCIKHQQKKRNIRRKKQSEQREIVNHGNKRGRKKMVRNQVKMQAPNISSAFQIIKEPNTTNRETSVVVSNNNEQKS